MDPSMFVPYTTQTNGVPLESKLATYMVIICNLFEKTPNKDIVLCYIMLLYICIYIYNILYIYNNNIYIYIYIHIYIHKISINKL